VKLYQHRHRGAKIVFDVSSEHSKLDLGDALVAHRGYFSSVKFVDCHVLSNVNVSYDAFYDPTFLDQLMDTCCNAYGLGWVHDPLKILGKFVKGLQVVVPHLYKEENGRTSAFAQPGALMIGFRATSLSKITGTEQLR